MLVIYSDVYINQHTSQDQKNYKYLTAVYISRVYIDRITNKNNRTRAPFPCNDNHPSLLTITFNIALGHDVVVNVFFCYFFCFLSFNTTSTFVNFLLSKSSLLEKTVVVLLNLWLKR